MGSLGVAFFWCFSALALVGIAQAAINMGAIVSALVLSMLAFLLMWRWFAHRLQGFTGDCLGATQHAAQGLAAELPEKAELWVSPLQRCELLAQSLRGLRPDLPCKTDARLVEMNFGHWEGVAWADIPRTALDAWTADFGNHRFGGVESANAVLSRVAQQCAGLWSVELLAILTRFSEFSEKLIPTKPVHRQ
jgi:hypothetical protein